MKEMEAFALIVVVRDQPDYLNRILDGVLKSDLRPDEMIIVNVGSDLILKRSIGLNIKVLNQLSGSEKRVSTATARNFGAERSTCEHLVFMNNDCIPSKSFFRQLVFDNLKNDGLTIGNPRYLLWPLQGGHDDQQLFDSSVPHPYRPIVEETVGTHDHNLFAGLCFSINKGLFFEFGGFSEAYLNHRVGDVDFAFRLRKNLYPLTMSSATVYHQRHDIYSPPLDNFLEIVKDSRVFYRKYSKWPIQRTLNRFVELQLIKWAPYETAIDILSPTRHRQAGRLYRSSASI